MAERVRTGGLMSFDYSKKNQAQLSENEKKEIEEAYLHADERKRREKRRRILIIVIALLLIITIIGWTLKTFT